METDKFEVRKEALAVYISEFVSQVTTEEFTELIIDINEAAESIAELYFRYTEEVIRPTLAIPAGQEKAVIQHYKIIAFTEFCVLRVQPIEVYGNEDQLTTARYNARLALHIALAILMDWNELDPAKFRKLISTDSNIQSFLAEHTTWMTTLEIRYYFPGFSNSQIWRLFHYLISDRIKHI